MVADPIAFFITWTVYGTHLQGHARGWRKWGKGLQPPQPKLEKWHAERLKYPVLPLTPLQREVVATEIKRVADFKNWVVHEIKVLSNHVHLAITASGKSGDQVRDQLKANCTRVIREQWAEFVDRPVWTVGGDWKKVATEKDLESVVAYIRDGQD